MYCQRDRSINQATGVILQLPFFQVRSDLLLNFGARCWLGDAGMLLQGKYVFGFFSGIFMAILYSF